MQLSPNAMEVLNKRYLKKNDDGKIIETPEEMFDRVAKYIAKAYVKDTELNFSDAYNDFYNMMVNLDFLPNTPTLLNAGTENPQLFACFFLQIEDSMDSIFGTLHKASLIFQSGGGCGFDFSKVRPKGDKVHNCVGVASGVLSFMKCFNVCSDVIKSGGKRRAAIMSILRVDHPEILDFIQCKLNEKMYNNFNISVAITDKFMEAVKNDGEYDIINPRTYEVVDKYKAREVFELLCLCSHRSGEPGVIFIDTVNKDDHSPELGPITGCNPCGEIFLHNAASCVLGSINLGNMIYKHIVDGLYYVDWDRLRNTVRCSVNFLDASIDANKFPIDGSEEVAKYTREIGLGIMGWADMLAKLGIQYDSQQALDLAEQVMAYIHDCAKCASEKLDELNKPGRSPNRGLTAIAPTGTRAMIADCSYGAEPYFSICHRKNVMDKTLYVTNPLFEQMLKDRGIYSGELMDKVAGQQSIQDIQEIPEDIRMRFRTAYDVSPEYHIKMQAAFQKHISNAISKSVNMRNDATVEDVKNAYLLAYELGCKGITVYRDGSRSIQVVDAGHEKCPECGGKVDRKEKCSSCVDCGWSKCSL